MSIQQEDKSLGELVAAATKDLSALVKGEVALAKAELKQEAVTAAKGGAMFGAAAVVGLLAFLFVSIAAAFGIGGLLGGHPGWGFLIVGAVYGLLGGILLLVGRKSMKAMGKPERTIRQAKETTAWARHPTRVTD